MRIPLLAALLLAAPVLAPPPIDARPAAARPQEGLLVVPLSVRTPEGAVHRYRVEVARTPEEQAIGMMHRRSMRRDEGMLFPMDPPREAAFWMKDTLIPLDLLFIGPDRRVIRVARGQPRALDLIPSGGRVAAVLELKAGEAARAGIVPGSAVDWRLP